MAALDPHRTTDAVQQAREAGLRFEHALIGDARVPPGDGDAVEVHDPASGALVGRAPRLGAAAAAEAIAAAERALPRWRARPAAERAKVLRAWADAMLAAREPLALLVTCEGGKPLAEARAEVDYAAGFLDWFAEEARRTYGQIVPSPDGVRRLLVLRRPIGVAAAITPWNFPLAMITRKAGAALAAGCTLVVKPAEQTPLSALALAELALQAGVPAGVLNVVTGGREEAPEIGAALCESDVVRKLSFTGSTAVGKLLAASCAATVTNVSLELGGNAPLLVFADADLDLAVAQTLSGKFRNSGQTCICPNRVLVHDAVHDAFAERLTAAVERLPVGPGLDPQTRVGPLIDARGHEKVARHVADACERGAVVRCGGEPHALGGTFWTPTVLTDVPADAAMSVEETFGPVVGLARFGDETEAVRLANDTPSGLAGYAFTRDPERVWRLAEQLECGIVGLNTTTVSTPVAPFGGMKESGIGREGGARGIDEWLETTYACVG